MEKYIKNDLSASNVSNLVKQQLYDKGNPDDFSTLVTNLPSEQAHSDELRELKSGQLTDVSPKYQNVESKIAIKTDKTFWFYNPSLLYNEDKYLKFIPTYNMSFNEKLNAIMRFSIYLGLASMVLTKKIDYLYIPIIVGFATFILYNKNKKTIEKFEVENNEVCVKPSYNNPFMNYNIITDDRKRPAGCQSYDNTTIKRDIEDKFSFNLYRDVSDLYGKNNSQRQYYQMPSTTMPNKQTEFAKWCFNTGPTCKEKGMYCATPYNDNIQGNILNINNPLN